MKRLSVLVVIVMMLGVLLSACGGGGASDPVGVVKDMMTAVVDKKFDKVAELACAAQKDQIKSSFNPASAFAGAGIDAQKILDTMTISFANQEYTKVSESGDKATVQVKGKITINFDREKLKTILADVFKTQGLSDDQINQALDAMAGQLGQGQDVDNKIDLIKENGKWVVCQ